MATITAERLASFPTLESMTGYTTAQKIRACRATQETEDRGAIAKYLGIRYQWVRNVLTQKVKEATVVEPKVIQEMTAEDLGL
jgi:hypothetical protein